MFNKFLQLTDDQIKGIFEHFRNLGICSAIFVASDWQYSQIDPLDFGLSVFGAFIFSLLMAVGAWLLLITLMQTFRMLKDYGFKGAKLKFISSIYSLAVISLIVSIFVY
jgi:hypothetical protein